MNRRRGQVWLVDISLDTPIQGRTDKSRASEHRPACLEVARLLECRVTGTAAQAANCE